jgi:hypothetical protein
MLAKFLPQLWAPLLKLGYFVGVLWLYVSRPLLLAASVSIVILLALLLLTVRSRR